MRYSTLFGHTHHAAHKVAGHATKDAAGHDLLIRAGYVRQQAAGLFTYCTLGLRALRRLEAIVRSEMAALGAQEILMTVVQDASLWRASGRYDAVDETLVRFRDRHGRALVLGMTHEEVVTALAATELQTYRQLDCTVFQIQTKIRDEARARSGLLRTREFLMKDAYSFHLTQAGLEATYAAQAAAYLRIFRRAGFGDVVMARSSSGDMGGAVAHEFAARLAIGEDDIAQCLGCSDAWNTADVAERTVCAQCGGRVRTDRAVEVGNIFQLGTRYTDAFDVGVATAAGARQRLLMGCYGIGVSRLLACVAERYRDAAGLTFTAATAALDAHVVVLGRDQGGVLAMQAAELTVAFEHAGFGVLLDDRADLSAGVRLADADLLGATVRVTLGRETSSGGTIEIRERRTGRRHVVAAADAVSAVTAVLRDVARAEAA